MDDLRFAWSEEKARLNERKHGVTFEEAATVFSGRVQRRYDRRHGPEHREIAVGFSDRDRLLCVVIYELEEDHTIRIISARRATRAEGLRFFAEGHG